MLKLIVGCLVVPALVLAACGDDDDDTTSTVTEPGVSETTPTEGDGASGPSGALTPTGVGEVEQGMTLPQAEDLIGQPTGTQKVKGCELDPNATDSTAATYNVEGGGVVFLFGKDDGGLDSYRSTSTALETEKGDTVGDPFTELQEHWGDELTPLDLGAKSTPDAGIWEVVESDASKLSFQIQGGTIAFISGGDIKACE